MLRTLTWVAAIASAIVLLFVAGCGSRQAQGPSAKTGNLQATQPPDRAKEISGDHAHKPGAHGGNIVEIGRDNYHAEPVFEKDGVVRLYTLGKDEAKVVEVEAQMLTAYVKPAGGSEATSVLFKAAPQPGDSDGKTSQFLGKLPRELWGQTVEITVPSIHIAGERFRFSFSNASASHGEELATANSADEDEKKLYLTAGGKYSEDDIKANGNVTASQKFKGLTASHDLKPNPGDKICPITLTKANPKFTWVVGGKAYEFCCPPCVDEFVKMAKETPGAIKEPETYKKK